MTTQSIFFSTTQAREDNPKAVFLGTADKIVHPLAQYLSQRSVDLFAGKSLSDAFFGDYFFYVGSEADVKDFLVENISKLPRTLLLLTTVSDLDLLLKLSEKTTVKLVLLHSEESLDEKKAAKIIEFFLGSTTQTLKLSEPNYTKTERSIRSDTNQDFSQIPRINPQPGKVKQDLHPQPESTGPVEGKNITTSEPVVEERAIKTTTAQIPASDTPPPKDNVASAKVASFFAENAPNLTRSKERKKPWLKMALITLICGICLLALPLIVFMSSFTVGSLLLYGEGQVLLQNKPRLGQTMNQGAGISFSLAKTSWSVLNSLVSMANKTANVKPLSQLVAICQNTNDGIKFLLMTLGPGKTLYAGIFAKDPSENPAANISAIKNDLSAAELKLSSALAEIKTPSLQLFFTQTGISVFKTWFTRLETKITSLQRGLVKSQLGLEILPDTLGLYGKRIYLLALQNNMELRPTGGFIGSYGLLTFEDGKLQSFTVEDIYTADGVLKGHVDPPPAIRVHLGQEHWYMRDSNWDPDFSQSGARLAWFLEKETDTKVDGVIAVNLNLVEELLKTVGGVELMDYGEKVTAENLFALVQTHAEADFFPGSTQKRDFLGSLTRALYDKLQNHPTGAVELLRTLELTLRQKNALVFFINPKLEQLVSLAGWSGETTPKQLCTDCTMDQLLVVDANLGVNKANYYVTRIISDTVEMTQTGEIQHEVAVHYRNDSPAAGGELGGEYKNYVRLLIPSASRVASVSVDNLPLALTQAEVASASAASVTVQSKATEVAALLQVGVQAEKTLTVTYSLPAAFDKEYVYTLFKQPGTNADKIQVIVKYPGNWQVAQVNGATSDVAGAVSLAKESQITYNTILSEDKLLYIKFQP